MSSYDPTPISYAEPSTKTPDADIARYARLLSTWAVIGLVIGLLAASGFLLAGVMSIAHKEAVGLLFISGSAVQAVTAVLFYLVLRLIAAYTVTRR